jgi:quinol monooxygenase YgiN
MAEPRQVVTIAEVSVRDVDAARDMLTRAAAHITDHLPGTLSWDIYLDHATGKMTMVEVFDDQQALSDYEASMTEQGFRDELLRYAQPEHYLVLGDVSDPGLRRVADSWGASHQPLAVSARPGRR